MAQTPGGLIVASQDRKALDDFESLLRTVLEQTAQSSAEPTIFWLKFAKADVAAQMLNQILGGGTGGRGGGSLVGDVAASVVGDVGGGILGSLLGGGGSSVFSGSASIVPDVRLNCLIVQAGAADLQLIEQLLPIIDSEAGPEEVQTGGKPRLIPVIYMSADEMANIVRQVYADRVVGADAGRQRQPSPEDFIRALRGGGRGGSREESAGEIQKMTIGVDARSNSLIVAAPEPLFKEVEELVAQLDDETILTDESVEVISIKGKPTPKFCRRRSRRSLGRRRRCPAARAAGLRAAGPRAAGPRPVGPPPVRRTWMTSAAAWSSFRACGTGWVAEVARRAALGALEAEAGRRVASGGEADRRVVFADLAADRQPGVARRRRPIAADRPARAAARRGR